MIPYGVQTRKELLPQPERRGDEGASCFVDVVSPTEKATQVGLPFFYSAAAIHIQKNGEKEEKQESKRKISE